MIMYIYVLGMNITTNNNTLAWTLSDNTAGSGKQKRGAKVKVATGSQDVLTSAITKFLGDSTNIENSNTARQLSLQEEQLKLDKRKMALLEKEHAARQEYGSNYGRDQYNDWHGSSYRRQNDEWQGYRYDDRERYRNDDSQGYRNDNSQGYRNDDSQGYRNDDRQGYRNDDRQGYRNSYGRSAPDQQQYHDHRYGRPAPDQEQYDDGHGPPPRERTAQELIDRRWCGYGSTYDRLAQNYQRDSNGRAVGHHTALQRQALGEIHARNGSYKENCEVMSMDGTVSKPASSTKYYSPVLQDDSYSSHYQSIPTNSAIDLTGDGNILI